MEDLPLDGDVEGILVSAVVLVDKAYKGVQVRGAVLVKFLGNGDILCGAETREKSNSSSNRCGALGVRQEEVLCVGTESVCALVGHLCVGPQEQGINITPAPWGPGPTRYL